MSYLEDLSWTPSGEMIPCYYDIKLGKQYARLDGKNYSWRFNAQWMGKVDPEWVRRHGTVE